MESTEPDVVPRIDDPSADFLACVEMHWETMRRVSWRFSRAGDAEDVLQNALLAAWRHWANFDEKRGTAAAWLTTITINEARKSRRSWRRSEQLGDLPATGPNVHLGLDVHRAVSRLPKRQATAVALHYYVGLPVRDIADVMGCAEGTVKSTLAAARSALRTMLGEDYP